MHPYILFFGGVVLAISSSASPLNPRISFPVASGLNTYCTSILPFDQQGDSLTLMASCAPSGAHNIGTTLSTSTIDINQCLANSNGIITSRAYGGALGSCNCDFGTHVCGTGPGCSTTTARCVCKAKTGVEYVSNLDIGQMIGVGYDSAHHFVLYCSGIYGSWEQCEKEGAHTTC